MFSTFSLAGKLARFFAGKRTPALRIIVIALAVLCGGSAAEACICAETPPPPNLTPKTTLAWEKEVWRLKVTDQFDRAIAVFSGQVVEDDIVRVRFKLDRVWKGTLPREFFMATGARRVPNGFVVVSFCDFGFAIGKRFIVFAFGRSIETMKTGSCTFTSELEHASRTVEFLDALVSEKTNRRKGRNLVQGDLAGPPSEDSLINSTRTRCPISITAQSAQKDRTDRRKQEHA